MLRLFNGCYCTEPTVSPDGWAKAHASVNRPWFIFYRFYDPTVVDSTGKPKPCLRFLKHMNKFKTLQERRQATREALAELKDMLCRAGWNPITRRFMAPREEITHTLAPDTLFFDALQQCLKTLDKGKRCKQDITSNLNYIKIAIDQLRYGYLPIKDVRRRHIKCILSRLARIKPSMDVVSSKGKNVRKGIWTNNTFNQYRKNLSILFEELMEMEATEVNPVLGIKRKKHAKQIRQVLTPEECQLIDDYTFQFDRHFWLFIHTFYHSGARESEILRVQGKHVNLKKQSVKYLVLKGRDYQWVERPIKDIALPFWQKALEGCAPDDYVFSAGQKPGRTPISPRQLPRKWKRHIKDRLGIDCGMYMLKHLNTTRTVDYLELMGSAGSQALAARQNGHANEKMVATVYDIKSRARIDERVRQVDNPFVPGKAVH